MKRFILPALAGLLVMTSVADAAALKTKEDRLSYSMGIMTGKAFRSHKISIAPKAFSMGVYDGYLDKKPLLSDAQVRKTLADFQKQSMKRLQEKMKKMAKQNAKQSASFLAMNKKKPGVRTLTNGLQYKVIRAGKGKSPSINDTVTVNYEGRLINGKVFDSSYKRGKPATFPLKGVIKGWQIALVKMKPGAIWEVYVPAKLAYGKTGAPGLIGPEEALIFKIDLISVNKKK